MVDLLFPAKRSCAMTDAATLIAAVERYLEMMFDSDVGRFEQIFAPSAQLHGLRDGNLRILPAAEYRKLLASNPSPKSKNAPRQQEILLVDFASLSQAFVKVRVRIDTILYLDYLSFHLIGGAWFVTAKFFHIEKRFEPQAA
jgi:Putative lumazine-binding